MVAANQGHDVDWHWGGVSQHGRCRSREWSPVAHPAPMTRHRSQNRDRVHRPDCEAAAQCAARHVAFLRTTTQRTPRRPPAHTRPARTARAPESAARARTSAAYVPMTTSEPSRHARATRARRADPRHRAPDALRRGNYHPCASQSASPLPTQGAQQLVEPEPLGHQLVEVLPLFRRSTRDAHASSPQSPAVKLILDDTDALTASPRSEREQPVANGRLGVGNRGRDRRLRAIELEAVLRLERAEKCPDVLERWRQA